MGDTATTDEEVSYGNLAVGRSQLNGGPDGFIEPTSPLLVRTDPAIPEVTNIVEVRDPNVVRVFNNLRAFIWQRGITLEWWEQHFGAVRAGTIYGERFWPGFFSLLNQYLPLSKLWWQRPENFSIAYLKKNLPSSRGWPFQGPSVKTIHLIRMQMQSIHVSVCHGWGDFTQLFAFAL